MNHGTLAKNKDTLIFLLRNNKASFAMNFKTLRLSFPKSTVTAGKQYKILVQFVALCTSTPGSVVFNTGFGLKTTALLQSTFK